MAPGPLTARGQLRSAIERFGADLQGLAQSVEGGVNYLHRTMEVPPSASGA
jgi:hypothetical protein